MQPGLFKPSLESRSEGLGGARPTVALAIFGYTFQLLLALDLSEQVRNGRRIHGDRFSGQTDDSGPISDHFWCFGPDLKIRYGPKLGPEPPKLGLEAPTRPADSGTFFLGPILELFLSPISGIYSTQLRACNQH